MIKKDKLYKNIPESPGVYKFKDKKGELLYVGKAANLKKRVSSYFNRPHDRRIEAMVNKINKVDFEETSSALEALILESNLIKKHKPPFNIKEKDDRSFLWVKITDKEKYPRVLLARGTEKQSERDKSSSWYGPFTNSSDIRSALRILRKIFPYNTHANNQTKTPSDEIKSRGCTYYQIGLCPGTCVGKISEKEYKKIIKGLKKVLEGKRKSFIKTLEKEMKQASNDLEFEKAQEIKKKIFSLKHIQDVSLISESNIINKDKEETKRVEGYDISNISGTSAVGSMVVMENNEIKRSQYRKFKIKTIKQQDDVGMIKEVINRRLDHEEWPFPDLILVDGGKGQVNGAKEILEENGFDLPIIGIAKGKKRKKNEFIGNIPDWSNEKDLIRLRDEAHRFAISYHKEIRKKKSGI